MLGAGPAGCAAATLLARRAHRVALVCPGATPAGALAESVPPSADKLLRELGLLDAVRSAGFQENLGNTVWWAGRPRRSEPFPGGERGVHVERGALERVLARAAEAAGAHVYDGFTAREAEETEGGWTVTCRGRDGRALVLRAPWLVDASGRRGFLARREGRERDPFPATLALVGRYRRHDGWPAEEGHTLVESWQDGWAWSVPLDHEVRCFAAMVENQVGRAGGTRAAFLRALARAPELGAMVAAAEPVGRAWACSASLYAARRYARTGDGGGVLLAGDAGSFIDPLSSFGVKKALSSGWLAGVVAHTALVDPPLAAVAADFFDRREQAVWRAYRHISIPFYDEAAEAYGRPYWRSRAAAARTTSDGERFMDGAGGGPGGVPISRDDVHDDPSGPPAVPEAEVRRAFERIRARARLGAVPGRTRRTFRAPAVEGHRVVLQDQLASDAYPVGMRFARGVDLCVLVEQAPRHDEVPDLWSAYNGAAVPVALPDFLTALSLAFAAGFLEHEDE